jgi:homoserine kinase
VSLRVPATSANLGPGFDCLGLALDLWADASLESHDAPKPGPQDPLLKMVLAAARAYFERYGVAPPPGLTVAWRGDFPVARGLGASAAARAAGLVGASVLAGRPPDPEELLPLGAELEGHADNIAPALLGGLQVAVREEGRVMHVAVPVPPGLKVVLMVPEQAMPTNVSRRLLATEVPREDAVFNVGRAALLVAALAAGRLDLLAAACDDRLHQPARSKLLPAIGPVIAAARQAGAACAYLSGGGSTIAAWAVNNEDAVAAAMLGAAKASGCPGETMITQPSDRGIEIVGTE